VLVPRFLANGGDPSRLHIVSGVQERGKHRPFNPATDMARLAEEVNKISDVKLVTVDPVVLAVAGDSHKNAEVRHGLQPLVDLAADTGAGVLSSTHFSKASADRDPLERVIGSVAFAALARVVLGTARPREEDVPRRLVRLKSNIGPDGGGFEYGLKQMQVPGMAGIYGQRVVWGSALNGPARDLLAEIERPATDATAPQRTAAEDWLRSELAAGPVPAVEIMKRAAAAGIGARTLDRAKASLDVKAHKTTMKGGWVWSLPPKVASGPEGRQADNLAPFEGGPPGNGGLPEGRQAESPESLAAFDGDGGLRPLSPDEEAF
jgi:hypothetical protein